MSSFKYKAFISYSHEDESTARWLHRALENYRPPRGATSVHSTFHSSRYPLRPIFRDQDELVASANLSDSLLQALRESEFLIVICSPNSVSSRWTSQEILEFKRFHGPSNVIAVIAEGDTRNSFPKPLLHTVLPSGELDGEAIEPLAADLQGGRTQRRLALLKIVATLLGTGLDQLVQREAQRRHRVLAMVSAAAVTGMMVMGWLTYAAVTARDLAEQSEQLAEQRREEAEGLIEFMLTDLRDRLEPVGRLDVLDAVGERAIDYYAGQGERHLAPESLGRRARALHLLGEISNLRGDVEVAKERFTLAAKTTGQQLEQAPDDPDRIFDHAQSVFWIGLLEMYQGSYTDAQVWFERYLDYAKQLVVIDDQNPKWLMELYFGHSNLGGLYVEQERWQEAVPSLERALAVLEVLEGLGGSYEQERVETHSWLRSAHLPQMNFAQAEFHNQQEVIGYESMLQAEPGNARNQLQLVVAYRGSARLALIRNDTQAALDYLMPQEARLAQLNAVEPEDTSVMEQQALLLGQLAQVRLHRKEWTRAIELAARCQTISEYLLSLNHENVFWFTDLNWPCRQTAAQAAFYLGRVDSAQAQLDTYYPALLVHHRSNPGLRNLDRLLGESLILLGDIALNREQKAQAMAYWQQAKAVVGGDLAQSHPNNMVLMISALNRLNETARAQELAEYLDGANYRHPALLRETLASR